MKPSGLITKVEAEIALAFSNGHKMKGDPDCANPGYNRSTELKEKR